MAVEWEWDVNRADQNSAIYNTEVAEILVRLVRDDHDEQHRHSRQMPTRPRHLFVRSCEHLSFKL